MIVRRLALPVVVALALIACVGPVGAAPGHTPRIGGPPPYPVEEVIPGLRIPAPKPFAGPKRTGPEILLGVGHRNQLEIVGYRTPKSACIFVASRQLRGSGGGCGGVDYLPPEGHSLFVTGAAGVALGSGERLSQIGGQLSPDIATVRLRYRIHGALRHSHAVVARVRGHLQERLGVAHSFGRFVATFHGCSSQATVTALDADGEVLESTTISGDVLHLHVPCKGDASAFGAVSVEPGS